MSEPENFLTRWSRRKLEAEEGKGVPQPDETASPSAVVDAVADTLKKADDTVAQPRPGEELAFDITTLPSLDSITAQTDISMFMNKGVPAELTRAALRRAWSADPAIRDFIEIAENQYDFATGKDLPGFGPLNLGGDELRRMVAEVFGGRPEDAAKKSEEDAEKSEETASMSSSAAEPDTLVDLGSEPPAQEVLAAAEPADEARQDVQCNKVIAAVQQSNTEVEQPPHRPHGRALPQ